jgi:hypothetical protein
MAGAASAKTITFTTFDVPGAQATYAYNINDSAIITGSYTDSQDVTHGYLRAANGTFTAFDPSGSVWTHPVQTDHQGQTVGIWEDSSGIEHGFLRSPSGTITKFDVSGALETTPEGVEGNAAESIGSYEDSSDASHGFLRARKGTITTFDASGAGTGAFQGTFAVAINRAGVGTGSYVDSNYGAHGFVRSLNGAITEFDVEPTNSTEPNGINDTGTVAGSVALSDGSAVFEGFLRTSDGTTVTFSDQNAGIEGTVPYGINDRGDAVGTYYDSSDAMHGFLRSPSGAMSTLDAPGAGTAKGQGTSTFSVNKKNSLTGFYIDASNAAHGYIAMQ